MNIAITSLENAKLTTSSTGWCGIAYDLSIALPGAAAAQKFLENLRPDVVVINLATQDAEQLLNLGRSLQDNHVPVIYQLNGRKNDAADAFDVADIYALCTPAKIIVAQKHMNAQRMFHLFQPSCYSVHKKSLHLKKGGYRYCLPYSSIYYIEAGGRYNLPHTTKGIFRLSVGLKGYEYALQGTGLHRIHRLYLVNLKKMEQLTYRFITMAGDKLPIGRVYRKSQ